MSQTDRYALKETEYVTGYSYIYYYVPHSCMDLHINWINHYY